MELTNDFTVSVPVEEAWALLTDLERIAPCMPGAKLEEVQGDDYLGLVKVKVGPITSSYKGRASFVERDDEKHRAVLRAEGRDTRGQGNAHALITAQLEPAGDATRVTVVTELNISGKIAQFGRGALADVSTKLLGQFVSTLEATLLAEPEPAEAAAATGSAAQDSSGPQPVRAAAPAAEPEPVDLLATVPIPPAVRYGVPAGIVFVLLVLRRGRRRRARR